MKEFHIGDILSVTHDKLLSPRLIEGVYDILNYMTGESLFTHQLPRVGREAGPVLRKHLPFLDEIDVSDITKDNWKSRLDVITAKYGAMHPVPKLTPDEHEIIDPMSELAEKVRPDNIVVVTN
ncbi:MAG: hypothetical protein RIA64_01220 [Rhodospirillales bacterium]